MARRSVALFGAVAFSVVTVIAAGPLSAADAAVVPGGAPGGAPNAARAAALRAEQAFQARMVARAAAHPLAVGTPAARADQVLLAQPIAADAVPSVNGAEPDTVTEADIAIDPASNHVITAVAQEGRIAGGGAAGAVYATSHDGGRTWVQGNLPLLTQAVGGTFQATSDIADVFGSDGSVYAVSIPNDLTDARSGVAVQRSADGGLTFGPPSLVVDDNNPDVFNDKPWIAIDNNRGSPFYGRLYAVWSRQMLVNGVLFQPGTVAWSDDHGRTWSPFRFTGPESELTEGLIPLIAPDGAVTVVYDQTIGSNDFEVAQTSHDGGSTWTAPATIGQFLGAGVPGLRTGGLPAAAIDPSTGQMYVAWQDNRFNAAGLNDIVLSTSTDGGHSWSAPRPVSPAGAGLDRFTPAVAAAAGKVYLSYGTRAASGTAPTVSDDLIVSQDGGQVFSPQQQTGPSAVLADAAVAGSSAFLGDYTGLAATPQVAALAWCVSGTPPVSERYHQLMWETTLPPALASGH